MPGPYGTATLDDFNRANGAIGASYGADPTGLGFHPTHVVSSNACTHSGGFNANWWLGSFAADQECYVTIASEPDGNGLSLQCRLSNVPGTTITGYELTIVGASADSELRRLNNTTGGVRGATQIALLDPITWNGGDKVALACVGSSIEAWRDTGGGWTQIGAATDATFGSGGFIGFWSQNVTISTFDDFGGGSIVTGPTPTRQDYSKFPKPILRRPN